MKLITLGLSAAHLRVAPSQDASPEAQAPQPVADGSLLGADGRGYDAATPLADIPGILPSHGRAPSGTALFVNGIRQGPTDSLAAMQRLSDATGCKVVGLYNATEGTVADLRQSARDWFDRGDNAAVTSLARHVVGAVQREEPVRLLGYSQGTLIISRALRDARDELVRTGKTPEQAETLLAKVQVETFAGAARSYPDGPRYAHYVNEGDWASLVSGFVVGEGPTAPLAREGKEAVVHRFKDGTWASGHNLARYLRFYDPVAG